MKRQFLTIFAILFFVIAGAVVGKASPVNRMEFEIPFDFIVKDQTMPAGKYTVERLNPNAPYVWILRKIDGKCLVIIQTQRTIRSKAAERALLSFDQMSSGRVLAAFWEPRVKWGYRVEQVTTKSH